MLEIYRGTNFERGESDTLGNIGGVYLLLGQYREALRYYQQALAISERLKLKASASQDLGNLALCYLGLGQIPAGHRSLRPRAAAGPRGRPREGGGRLAQGEGRRARAAGPVRRGHRRPTTRRCAVYEQAKLQRELVEALNDRGTLDQRLGDAASAERQLPPRHRDCARDRPPARRHGEPDGARRPGMAAQAPRRSGRAVPRCARRARRRRTTAPASAAARVALAFVAPRPGPARRGGVGGRAGRRRSRRRIGARPLEAEALFARAAVARDAAGRSTRRCATRCARPTSRRRSAIPELAWRVAYGQGQALEALGRANEEAAASYRAGGAPHRGRSQPAPRGAVPRQLPRGQVPGLRLARSAPAQARADRGGVHLRGEAPRAQLPRAGSNRGAAAHP